MSNYIDFRYGILILTLLGLISCKAKKTIIPSQEKKTISDIITSSQSYSTYEAKAKIKFNSSEESFKGIVNLRMRRDSAILMAIKKLGVEGARTLIKQDSIIHIDRINHNYYIKDIGELSSHGISLTYDYVQLLLSATLPVIRKANIIDSSYTDNRIIIKTMINEMLHELYYDLYTGLLTEARFQDRFSITGHWRYGDYRLVEEDIYFPYSRIYEIENSADENLILELDFSNIDINTSKPIRINIPDSYNRIN